MEPVEGRPTVHLAILALAAVCREVIVVRPPGQSLELPGGIAVPAVVVHDARPYEGPLAGAAVGLACASQPLALVVGGDMPSLVRAALVILLCAAERSYRPAVALAEDGRLRPLPCVVRRDALSLAQGLLRQGRHSLQDFLGTLQVELVGDEEWRAVDPFARTLADIDLPGERPAFRPGAET